MCYGKKALSAMYKYVFRLNVDGAINNGRRGVARHFSV